MLAGAVRIVVFAIQAWGNDKRLFSLLRTLFGCLMGAAMAILLLALALGSFFPSIR